MVSRRAAAGFTYLGVLFLVALTAAALAALGQAWSNQARRDRELELEWRGAEIGRAIASYAKATPIPPAQYPRNWDDLLVDRRGVTPRHHLRRLYVDPFTLEADWVLLPEAGQPGRFSGVRSRSDQALLREIQTDGSVAHKASDRAFFARAYEGAAAPLPDATVAPPSASAASAGQLRAGTGQ